MPKVFEKLAKFEVDGIMYASGWYLTLFCLKLPFNFHQRIIDIFLIEQNKILYRVGLGIMYSKKE